MFPEGLGVVEGLEAVVARLDRLFGCVGDGALHQPGVLLAALSEFSDRSGVDELGCRESDSVGGKAHFHPERQLGVGVEEPFSVADGAQGAWLPGPALCSAGPASPLAGAKGRQPGCRINVLAILTGTHRRQNGAVHAVGEYSRRSRCKRHDVLRLRLGEIHRGPNGVPVVGGGEAVDYLEGGVLEDVGMSLLGICSATMMPSP